MIQASRYVPERGDLVWINFNPQRGHEQAGLRPAVVVSPSDYNRVVRLALFCPVTSQVKGYPFEVPIPPGGRIKGVVLADQIKSLDWRARGVEYVDSLPAEVFVDVLERLRPLVHPDSDLTPTF